MDTPAEKKSPLNDLMHARWKIHEWGHQHLVGETITTPRRTLIPISSSFA